MITYILKLVVLLDGVVVDELCEITRTNDESLVVEIANHMNERLERRVASDGTILYAFISEKDAGDLA